MWKTNRTRSQSDRREIMKGFFRWFKSSTKMKRWMLLILVGIVLACYGMAEILIYLYKGDKAKRIKLFDKKIFTVIVIVSFYL